MLDSALVAEFIKKITDPRLFNQLMSDAWGRGYLTSMVIAAVVKVLDDELREEEEENGEHA